jgi:hypothetical protein
VDSNTDFDDEMYGNWLQILEREHRQKIIDKEHFDRKDQPTKETEIEDHHQTHSQQVQTTVSEAAVIHYGSEIKQEKEGDTPQKTDTMRPKPINFNLPEELIQELIGKIVTLGMTLKEATDNIDKRKKLLNQAIKSIKHWKEHKN